MTNVLTFKEALEKYPFLKRNTLLKMLNNYSLDHFKIGNKYMIPEQAIEEWITQNAKKNTRIEVTTK